MGSEESITKMTLVKFNEKAYCKMIAHAAKYPHCTLNGILLAKASSLNTKEVEFVDTIPLFHISINLIPMAEIALMQVLLIIKNMKTCILEFYYRLMSLLQKRDWA